MESRDFLSAAVMKSVAPDRYLSPGLGQYAHVIEPLKTVGTHVAVIFDAATMPHMLLRLNASRTGRSARRSASIAVGLFGIFLLLLITAGFGFASAAVVGGAGIAADASGQSSLILLASHVVDEGSPLRTALITLLGCVIFLTVLTTVASVTFAAAVPLTHGVRARGKRVQAPEAGNRTISVAVALGVVGLSLSAVPHGYPTEFLSTFSLSAAASCIFPALVYSLFWRRFCRRRLVRCVYGGLLLSRSCWNGTPATEPASSRSTARAQRPAVAPAQTDLLTLRVR
ncbi:hypothetical protein [Streptomyces sp. NPDC101776]|uniref:sodium:solute symporter family transporter n=1 Tax=Streptomyces sp. NPDC101776 TaxID=3366146 RepID=UPI00382A9D98